MQSLAVAVTANSVANCLSSLASTSIPILLLLFPHSLAIIFIFIFFMLPRIAVLQMHPNLLRLCTNDFGVGVSVDSNNDHVITGQEERQETRGEETGLID